METARKMQIRHIAALTRMCIIASITMFSCGTETSYTKHFPQGKWSFSDTLKWQYASSGTSSSAPSNIYIDVAHADKYPFANIYFFSKISLPDGTEILDTINCILIDSKHDWTGKKKGGGYKASFLIKKNVAFNQQGAYKFQLVHAMRTKQDSLLNGINSVSLIIK
jgi:gliding motility-associated lipoprotein GldH